MLAWMCHSSAVGATIVGAPWAKKIENKMKGQVGEHKYRDLEEMTGERSG